MGIPGFIQLPPYTVDNLVDCFWVDGANGLFSGTSAICTKCIQHRIKHQFSITYSPNLNYKDQYPQQLSTDKVI